MRVAGTGAGHGALVEAIAAESAQKSHKKYTPFLPSCQFFFFLVWEEKVDGDHNCPKASLQLWPNA